jgi:hypothetical protein
MELKRLDRVARLVAGGACPEHVAGASRRGAIGAALGALLAAGTAAFGAERAEAGAGCKVRRRKCHHDSQCCTLRCVRRRCRR